MVKMPWNVPPPDEVDRLIRVAEELAMQNGAGPGTNIAAARAVAAARKRAGTTGSRDDRGRLLRALARVTVNAALERQPAGGHGGMVRDGADQIVALAKEVLAEPVPADSVRAEAVIRLAQAGQIIASAGETARGWALVEEAWETVAGRDADGIDARRARTAALTALVSVRLDEMTEQATQRRQLTAPPAAFGAQAAEMVDSQRALALEDGLDTSVYDLAEALGDFGRAAIFISRPDLAAMAWAEQVSILMSFDGPSARARFSEVTARLGGLMEMAPHVRAVVPGPSAWRTRGSYLDLVRDAPRRSGEEKPAATEPATDASMIADFTERLERGVALSQERRYADADALLGTLVGELSLYDAATGGDELQREVRRLWAKALWRRSMVVQASGRTDEAWELGRHSVTIAVERLDRLLKGTKAYGEALADAAVYMADAGEIAAAAGRHDDQIALLSEAVRRCEGADDRAVRRALGTALHNLATAVINRQASSGAPDPRALPEVARLAERACALRRTLVDPADPLTTWEYANTLVLASGVALLGGQWSAGVGHLSTAGPLLHRLGPAAGDMAARAHRYAAGFAERAPEVVSRARARGAWPY